MKRAVLAVLVVFVVWTLLDLAVNEIILASAYSAAPHLWRPMQEMMAGLMNLVVLTSAASFVLIYAWLITEKCLMTAVKYGILYGIGSGVVMGFGSYSSMPLPSGVAFWWFLSRLLEAVIAGWLVGVIVKKQRRGNWAPFGIRERGDYIKY